MEQITEKIALRLAEKSLQHKLTKSDLKLLLNVQERDVLSLLVGTYFIFKHNFSKINLCTIVNAKSGRCSEDCAFCAQSRFYSTNAPIYSFQPVQDLVQLGERVAKTPIHRYSLVTAGKSLPGKELGLVEIVVKELKDKINLCASLGILSLEQLETLKKAGLKRYHHNLETSADFFPNICTTHTYQQRIATIEQAKQAGLEVCSGGIFGLGETDEQVVDLALLLKDLEVDAVPINFLIPIYGTPLAQNNYLTPLRCLKIMALFRYILPDKEIIICGGRKQHLAGLNALIFMAGASGIMTGNYLTRQGYTLEEDLKLLAELGFDWK
ncbi:MAG: biotin synthase BioB [Desulfonauticus sp.]|nr:biotin synthase BioB [Desulfonauticus sp.]